MTARESSAVEKAVEAVLLGSSVLSAAASFGCSRSSVHRALRRRGQLNRPRTMSEKSQLAAKAVAAGELVKDVAKRLGMNASGIYRAAHRYQQILRQGEAPTTAPSRTHVSRPAVHAPEVMPLGDPGQPACSDPPVTPLLEFMRTLNEEPERLEEFVASLEGPSGKPRTAMYLYQLAGNRHPNPSLRLAHAIVHQSRQFAIEMGCDPLTYEDLLIGKFG